MCSYIAEDSIEIYTTLFVLKHAMTISYCHTNTVLRLHNDVDDYLQHSMSFGPVTEGNSEGRLHVIYWFILTSSIWQITAFSRRIISIVSASSLRIPIKYNTDSNYQNSSESTRDHKIPCTTGRMTWRWSLFEP